MCHNSQFITTCVCDVCNATNKRHLCSVSFEMCGVYCSYLILNNIKAYNAFYSSFCSTLLDTQVRLTG